MLIAFVAFLFCFECQGVTPCIRLFNWSIDALGILVYKSWRSTSSHAKAFANKNVTPGRVLYQQKHMAFYSLLHDMCAITQVDIIGTFRITILNSSTIETRYHGSLCAVLIIDILGKQAMVFWTSSCCSAEIIELAFIVNASTIDGVYFCPLSYCLSTTRRRLPFDSWQRLFGHTEQGKKSSNTNKKKRVFPLFVFFVFVRRYVCMWRKTRIYCLLVGWPVEK